MAQYGKQEYWEDRYQKDKERFDWYQRYSGLKDIITQYVQPNYQILNVGAGNSRKYNDFSAGQSDLISSQHLFTSLVKFK